MTSSCTQTVIDKFDFTKWIWPPVVFHWIRVSATYFQLGMLDSIPVGSTVRVRRSDGSCRRAIVATVEEATVGLVWDEEIAATLSLGAPDSSWRLRPVVEQEAALETTVSFSQIETLEEYETPTIPDESTPPSQWKEWGDTLLRRKDPGAAVPFYESALTNCASISIGGTVLVQEKGRIEIFDVDCVEGSQLEVTRISDGAESVLSSSSAFPCAVSSDDLLLQEKVLLNLTRCFVQLSERTLYPKRRPIYLRSAVRTSSLSVALSELSESGSTRHTGLLLRSQAQVALSKFPHAKADLQRILRDVPDDPDAQRALQKLQVLQRQSQATDRRVAKEVGKWVRSVVDETVSSTNEPGVQTAENPPAGEPKNPFFSWPFLICVLCVAILWQMTSP